MKNHLMVFVLSLNFMSRELDHFNKRTIYRVNN